MRSFLVSAAAVMLAFGGCLSAAPEAGDDVSPAASPEMDVRPDPSFTNIVTGPAAALDDDATLAEPPEWVVGEWWRIRFFSPLTGEEVEFVRVVAAVQDDLYVVGMPHEGWYKEAVVYHTPAFGDINRADLSYDTHDILFTPVKFPLEEGATWQTQFSGGPEVTAQVSVLSQHEAQVTFLDAEGLEVFHLVYDARLHEVREFTQQTVEFEVLEHGYDFEGWVTVPRGEDLVFFHARVGPVLDPVATSAGPPVETLTLSDFYNRVTFFTLASTDLVASTPGYGRLTATAPDGTDFVAEVGPQPGVSIAFHEHADPGGDWSFQWLNANSGLLFIEGIAYNQYDIRVPDGLERGDHSHGVDR